MAPALIRKSAAAPSIRPIAQQNAQLEKVAREIKSFSEEDHPQKVPESIAELYQQFEVAILNPSADNEVQSKKDYIAFKKASNLADISLMQKYLKLWINVKKGSWMIRDISCAMCPLSDIGAMEYELVFENDTHLEYIMSLIKQAIV